MWHLVQFTYVGKRQAMQDLQLLLQRIKEQGRRL